MRKFSPHLSIYKFPITAISSITNRASGMYLTGIISTSCLFTLLNENQKSKLINYYNNMDFYKQKCINYTLLYPFGYHFSGSVRHLVWDAFPNLLTNSLTTKSSRFLFLISILPTVLLEDRLYNKFKTIHK